MLRRDFLQAMLQVPAGTAVVRPAQASVAERVRRVRRPGRLERARALDRGGNLNSEHLIVEVGSRSGFGGSWCIGNDTKHHHFH